MSNPVEQIQAYRDTLDSIIEYVKELEIRSQNARLNEKEDTSKSSVAVLQNVYIPVVKFTKKPKCPKCNKDRLIKIESNDIYDTFKVCECFTDDVEYVVYKANIDKASKSGDSLLYIVEDPVVVGKTFIIDDSKVKMYFEEDDLNADTTPVYYYEYDAEMYCKRRNES
jgi:hypothetical protein